MELDIGSFDRAKRNHPHAPIKDWYEQGLIKVERYILPVSINLEADIGATRSVKILKGWKELWYKFAQDYFKFLDDPNIATIMINTGTIFYDLTCQGYLQELQEKQLPLLANGTGRDGKPLRVKLQKQEYTEPNDRMRAFAYQAKAKEKNLIVTHHATDEYGPIRTSKGTEIDKTGKRVMHGWKRWGDSADVMGRVNWNPAYVDPTTNQLAPRSEFTVDIAEVQELRNMTFGNPTWDHIAKFIAMMRGE
jgi:hypothetical protein